MSLPQVVRRSVEARAALAVDDRERDSVARFLAELDRLARPFDEDADPVHVTGSAVLVRDNQVLLHLHKRMGIWLQPGGHVDPGETPWDAAVRETREETGLDVRLADGTALLHVDVHAAPKGHTHLDLRYLLAVDGDDTPCPPEGESQDVAWFGWDDAVAVADPGLSGLLRHLSRIPPR